MTSELDIRALRRQRSWSQQDMADYLGLDRSTVSRLERGQEIPGPVRRLLTLLPLHDAAHKRAGEVAA